MEKQKSKIGDLIVLEFQKTFCDCKYSKVSGLKKFFTPICRNCWGKGYYYNCEIAPMRVYEA